MDSKNILNALKVGNVPQKGVFDLCVSRDSEINEFERILQMVSNNQSYVRFLNGEFGAGKSFLLKIIEEMALKNNFVVSKISIMDTSDIKSVYCDIMTSLISQNENSFKNILDNWLDEFQGILKDEQDFYNQILDEELYNSVKFSPTFISAIKYYNKFRGSNELEKASIIISWLSGDADVPFSDNNYGRINEFKFLQSLSYFIKLAGYAGLVILVDDVENIMVMDLNKRDVAYTSIKYLLDSCSLNKFKSSLFVFAGTPEWFVEEKKGIPFYESLNDMLKISLGTDLEDMSKPIMNLRGFDENTLKEIAEKLIILHENAYGWDASKKIKPVLEDIISIHINEASLIGGKVTPRTFIRSFVSVLDTVQQNRLFFTNPNKIIELFGEQETSEFDEINFMDIDEFDDDW